MIYDIFEFDKNQMQEDVHSFQPKEELLSQKEKEAPSETVSKKDRFFSSLTARLFFLLLFAADVLWFFYAATLFVVTGLIFLCSGFKMKKVRQWNLRMWLTVKRSLICGLSLFITLFSPAFGIMIACTYFLMYDKTGIEEVVPASLQSQFKEFFKQ